MIINALLLVGFYFMYYYNNDLSIISSLVSALVFGTLTFAALRMNEHMSLFYTIGMLSLISFDILAETDIGITIVALYLVYSGFKVYKLFNNKPKERVVEEE